MDNIADNINALDDRRKIVLKDVLGALQKGHTIGDLMDLSQNDIESLYTTGYNYYEAKQFDKALTTFQLLCLMDHVDKRFYMGLGASRQMLGQYKEALEAYGYVVMLDIDDPVPLYHLAECHLALGDLKRAVAAFESVIEFIEDISDKKKQASYNQFKKDAKVQIFKLKDKVSDEKL